MVKKESLLKIVLVPFLLVCLFDMPYGYYMFVRFISFVAFGLISYDYITKERQELAILFGALALLFQPFIKIALGRELWNAVDVIVAVVLVVLVIKERKTA